MSAEDVWGLITSEIKALHDSYVFVNKTVPAKQPRGRIFISKAVILLCAARKSRDADHLQNFVYDALAGIHADKLAAELLKAGKEKVPDYAFDCLRPPSPPLRLALCAKLSRSARLPHVEGKAKQFFLHLFDTLKTNPRKSTQPAQERFASPCPAYQAGSHTCAGFAG